MELRLLDSPHRLDDGGQPHLARLARLDRYRLHRHFDRELASCRDAVLRMQIWAGSQELECLPYLKLRFHTPTDGDTVEGFRAWVSLYDYLESYALQDIIVTLGGDIPPLQGLRALQYSDFIQYCNAVSTPVRRNIDTGWSGWNIDTPVLHNVFESGEWLSGTLSEHRAEPVPQREPDNAMGAADWTIHPQHELARDNGQLMLFGVPTMELLNVGLVSDEKLVEYMHQLESGLASRRGEHGILIAAGRSWLSRLSDELKRRQDIWEAGYTKEPPVPRGRFDRLTRLLPGDD